MHCFTEISRRRHRWVASQYGLSPTHPYNCHFSGWWLFWPSQHSTQEPQPWEWDEEEVWPESCWWKFQVLF